MALGKVRTNKRPSSSPSYCGSTISMAVFVALCVLGVWMLTSDSVIPPQTTTRTDTAAAAATTAVLAPPATLEPRADNNANNKKDSAAFDDTPSDLPDDAINSADASLANRKQQPPQDSHPQQPEQMKPKEPERDDDKNNAEEKANKEKGSVVEDNSHGLRGKEPDEEQAREEASETQVSEESSMTQNQQVEETVHNNNEPRKAQPEPEEDAKANRQNPAETAKDPGSENNREKKPEEEDEEKEASRTSDQTQESDARQRASGVSDEALEMAAMQQNLEDFGGRNPTHEAASAGGEAQEQDKGPQTAHIIAEDQANKAHNENNQESEPDHHPTAEGNKSPLQEPKSEEKPAESHPGGGSFPGGEDNSGIPKESKESQKSWATQADQSENQKERRRDDGEGADRYGYSWRLCNATAGPDYIPCLDNERAIRQLRSRKHFEHRERHCPEEPPACLVPLPDGYRKAIQWPTSRDKAHN